MLPKGRPLELAQNEPHAANWSPEHAEEIINEFIPADATKERSVTADVGYTLTLTEYRSATLKEVVPKAAWEYADNTPKHGAFEVLRWLPTDRQVTWIEIDLQIENSDYLT